ncbi:MAG: uroporphyrinogen-III decarboxylase-like protein [Armatimonadetes bacterium]|nr:uroporphyrinogen-III decarboxylase-like protein [Armatimonadota bacterium]
MHRETMTPRERWLAVLNREKPDRIPMEYWATPEATEKLLRHLNCDHDEMLERLHIDPMVGLGGRYVGPPIPENSDVFGIERRRVEYGTGAYDESVSAPLGEYCSVEEIEADYAWPKPDWWDYSHLQKEVEGKDHLPMRGGGSEPFLTYKALRGEAQAFMDLIENPDIVHYCLDRLFELAYQNTLRIFEAIPGKVMVTFVAEDLGGQTSLMYSPQHIRDYLIPRMRQMVELVKQHGSYVFHHSDGAVREILPDLIEMGIEVLNPVQWRCPGMEREGLKRDFGDRLIFHGGVDNQYTIPFGTVEEVRSEVEENIKTLGAGGGYIIAPCHNIQAVGPPGNVVALYETGYECGWQ